MRDVVICTVGALVVCAGAFAFSIIDGQATQTGGFEIASDGKGKISLPNIDFRKDWVALGAWAIAAEEGEQGSQGMHVVYTQPGTVEAFRKTGEFPDGAVLIKELFITKTQDMTTGTVSRADSATGWFVMVKDATGRFPGNNLWGDGWGWAYFDAKDPVKTTTTDYVADCKGCHVPVQDTDWVYVDGYPVLHSK